MGLFLKQTEQRTQLQEKIAADLANRTKPTGNAPDAPPEPVMLEESKEATNRGMFWVGVVIMLIIVVVVFVLFIFNGI